MILLKEKSKYCELQPVLRIGIKIIPLQVYLLGL
jgi:hypothetical protein